MSLQLEVTRKFLQEVAYTKQWLNEERNTDPQAQHVIPMKILLDNNCKSIIDFGTGNGLFLSLCKAAGMEVDGLELSEGGVKAAKEKYGIDIKQYDLDQKNLSLPYEDNHFDYSVSIGPPESIMEMKAFISEMLRIAKHTILVAPNFAFLALRVGFLNLGRHPGRTDPNIAYNFVTKKWIEYHINHSGAKIKSFRGTYPHDEKSGLLREQSPVSELFSDFLANPHAPIPDEYIYAEKMLSENPELFARFFVYELEKPDKE